MTKGGGQSNSQVVGPYVRIVTREALVLIFYNAIIFSNEISSLNEQIDVLNATIKLILHINICY